MKEIKIEYGSVENSLSKLKASIQSFDPSIRDQAFGSNSLKLMDELLEVNQLMEKLLLNYVGFLQKSATMSTNAVESMRETDEEVSSVISSGQGVRK